MKSKTIAKVGAFLTAFTVFAGSMLPVYAASVEETDSTEESTAAAAEGDEESFLFQLEVDGKDTVNVNPGDVITVSFTLKRTDAEEAYTMYAMQDEIAYDSNFFELVDGSALVTNGIETRDLAMRDNMRKFYMNYVSMSGGDSWQPSILIGTFQLKVTGTEGSSTISNEDCLVSYQDGSGSYPSETKDVTVVVSTDCKVHYETNGGSAVDDVTAVLGEKLQKPEDPVREGYYLEAWCTDMDLNNAWDFAEDTVKGNMTLYAKWAEGEPQSESQTGQYGIIIVIIVLAAAAGGAVWYRKKKQS